VNNRVESIRHKIAAAVAAINDRESFPFDILHRKNISTNPAAWMRSNDGMGAAAPTATPILSWSLY